MKNKQKIKLVLSGSGMLYPAHAGAIKALDKLGFEIDSITGVSGGAIIASLIASNYSINEILDEIKNYLPNDILDPSFWPFDNYGFIKGEKLEKILRKKLLSHFRYTSIPLNIVAVNINKRCKEIFSTKWTPDICIAEAVRASISIPGIFKAKKILNDLYVDGGIADNFPLDIYNEDKEVLPVIGLNICNKNPDSHKREEVGGIKNYISNIVESIVNVNSVEQIEDSKNAEVINLIVPRRSLDFNIDKNKMDAIITEGYISVINYFNSKEN